jgi:excisionase family DNA binding protein
VITPRPPAKGHENEIAVLEPLTVRIATAVQLTGISRSRLYELIETGELETVKVGRSTLIPYRSLKSLTKTGG